MIPSYDEFVKWCTWFKSVSLQGKILLCVLAVLGMGFIFFKDIRPLFRREDKSTPNVEGAMKVGNDSVVMGAVPPNLEVGDGSTIIGPTDANGNTIITQPMAVGRNAQAGSNSIAIGAGAHAGSESST